MSPYRSLFLALLICSLSSCFASFIRDWVKISQADPDEKLTFYVALPQRNLDVLERILYAYSDPRSPEYGRAATQEEISALVNPPKEVHDRVFDFFDRPNVRIISYGDALKITARVSDVASIFSASFFQYRHVPTGHTAIRADHHGGIVIPASIEKDVYMVTGLASFPIITKKHKTAPIADVEDSDFGYFAPSTLRRLYNITANAQVTNKNSSQAALEFTPEGAFSFKDLSHFCTLSDEKFTNYTHIVGPFVEDYSNLESELDVQLLATIGSGAENWFWTVEDGWIYEMAVGIFNNKTKPWVFSISYGWPEIMTCNSAVVQADCGKGDNEQYISRANAEIMKLGALRITVITCSQDEGAPSEANMYCANATHPIFGIYPASCPYLTTVSATSAVPDTTMPTGPFPPICKENGCSNSTTEYSCMPNNTAFEWTTGGGFSEITVSPSYQTSVVKQYLASKAFLPPDKYFWPKNRGYPDISAIGARTLIVQNGNVTVGEGTSASTPIIAGIATLLNDARFNAGKSPLGFLNPMLYTMATDSPKAFKDITTGSNECSIEGFCCKYGYGTTTGWDAVTGLGTPNFQEMLAYVQTLP